MFILYKINKMDNYLIHGRNASRNLFFWRYVSYMRIEIREQGKKRWIEGHN